MSYYRDERNDFLANNYNANPITNSESFKYESNISGKPSNVNQKAAKTLSRIIQRLKQNLDIVVPLKHLTNSWRTLEMSLINCEVSLTLTWSEKYVLTDITTQEARNANSNTDPPVKARETIDAPANATFKIVDTKIVCSSCYFIN